MRRWVQVATGLCVLLVSVITVLFFLPRFAERVDGQSPGNPICARAVIDQDGHSYRARQFGEQCWFDTNLKTLKYNDGTPISGAVFFAIETHGVLYRYDHVVHPSGLCPRGWHVPSDKEFKRLETSIGMSADHADASGWRGEAVISRVLKNYDTAFSWTDSERARVNKTGFSFTPSGAEFDGRISGENRFGDLWTSTEYNDELAWYRSLFWISITSPFRGDVEKIRRDPVSKKWAFSVRCVRSN